MGKKAEKAKEWVANDVQSRSKFGVKQQWRNVRSKVVSSLTDLLPDGPLTDMLQSLISDVEYSVDKKVNEQIDKVSSNKKN